eukprot:15454632-Alexandrium_andersonii.AAC.1
MELESSEGRCGELEAELQEAKPPPEPPPERDKLKGGAKEKSEKAVQDNKAESVAEQWVLRGADFFIN